jgi:hypothetical protein
MRSNSSGVSKTWDIAVLALIDVAFSSSLASPIAVRLIWQSFWHVISIMRQPFSSQLLRTSYALVRSTSDLRSLKAVLLAISIRVQVCQC